MNGELTGRVAFVTGGSQGIGRAIVEALAANGVAVGVCGLEVDRVVETVAAVGAHGGQALAVPADVTDRSSVERAVGATVERFGRLDALVTSAGIQRYGDVVDTDEAIWDQVMAVNLKGVFLCSKHAIPVMKANGGGNIVNVASTVSIVGIPDRAAYVASKGGVAALTRAMAIDHVADNIRVNSVGPGVICLRLVEHLSSSEGARHLPRGRTPTTSACRARAKAERERRTCGQLAEEVSRTWRLV